MSFLRNLYSLAAAGHEPPICLYCLAADISVSCAGSTPSDEEVEEKTVTYSNEQLYSYIGSIYLCIGKAGHSQN